MSYSNLHEAQAPFFVRYLSDLAAYRHLGANLVASDLRARFRRSYLGILWAVLQPLGFALLIAYVWGTMFQSTSYWDYALYVFSGMIIWEYFATIVNVSQDALTASEGYLKQTRIPFLIFQVRVALTGLVIMVAGFVGLLCLMAALNRFPTFGGHLLLVPCYFVLILLFMSPLAVIMSILGTKLRDLKYISMLAVQALFFVSPVMLGREIFESDKMLLLNMLNPMTQLLQMFRAPLLYSSIWTVEQMLTIVIWVVALWLAATWLSITEGRKLIFAL